MIYIKSDEEVKKIKESCRIIAMLFVEMERLIKPGVSTMDLDVFADEFIRKMGGIPSFKGYTVPGLSPYPGAICASKNAAIVHGIPSNKVILNDGDILGIDVGVVKNGYHGDAAKTFAVGSISSEAKKLLEVTSESLNLGINQARIGNRIGDISCAIANHVQKNGFFVADNLTGHGVGKELHEAPQIPNSGQKGKGPRILKGMTLAIEPMVNVGTNRVHENGWEFRTADNSLSAHFEHTILVTDGDPVILSIV